MGTPLVTRTALTRPFKGVPNARRASRRGAGHVSCERTHRGDGRAVDGHTPRDPPRSAVRVACRVLGISQTASKYEPLNPNPCTLTPKREQGYSFRR